MIATSTSLHHLAFENSVQANIISTPNSGQILLANKAACKMLGYTHAEMLKILRADIFDVTEPAFRKMLKQRAAIGNSSALVTAITKDGSKLPCEITSATFMDTDGAKKAITTICDISERLSLQKKIDIKREKTVVANIGIAKSKQRKIDQQNREKVAEDILVALAKSEAKLQENNDWIRYIARTSYDVMWDLDIASGEVYVGDSLSEVFGYEVHENKIQFSDFLKCLPGGSKVAVENKLNQILGSSAKSWDDAYQFERQDKTIASTVSRASIIRDDHGKAIRMIGAIQDISKLQELEQQITLQQKLTDKLSLATRLSIDVIWDWNLDTDQLFIGDQFEELFGYEIDYKNRLIPILTWLNYLHPDDRNDVEKKLYEIIGSTETRWENLFRFIRADGSIAEILNRASIFRRPDGKAYRLIGTMQDLNPQKDLQQTTAASKEIFAAPAIDVVRIRNFGLCRAIELLIAELVDPAKTETSFSWERFSENLAVEKWKVNVYKIVKEQVDNIIRHSQATIIRIGITQTSTSVHLHITDNGIGFDTVRRSKGTGFINIRNLASSYNGHVEISSQPAEGSRFIISFTIRNCMFNAQPVLEADSSKARLAASIKEIIKEMILNSDQRISTNFSTHLSKICGYDYTYLSNLFTEIEGQPIRQFIIHCKIERVKQMMLVDDMTLTQISLKLHYSSVAHLSSQFKKVTGLTPSAFKQTENPAGTQEH